MTNANPLYLPLYLVFIDYIDLMKTDIYTGELYWNGDIPKLKLFETISTKQVSDELFRINVDPNNDIDSIKMGLYYTNKNVMLKENKEVLNRFLKIDENDEIVIDETDYKTVQKFIVFNQKKIMKFISNYNSCFIKM